MMVANNVLDYPINVNKGDTVVVIVKNHLNVSTSLHWHGLYQVDTPWMDGPGMVSQCLIQSGKTFTYKFNTGDQVGTYWWHAHSQSQYLALEPVPDSGLINGKGQCNCSIILSKQPQTKCVANRPMTEFSVVKGKRYRLRFINMSAQAAFNVSIDGHSMKVIEQDASSQRYSVIVTADRDVGNYWFRATMMDMYTPTGTIIRNGVNFSVAAIWRYQGAKRVNPTTIQQTSLPLDVFSLGELNGMTENTIPAYNTSIYFQFTIAYDPATNKSISPVTLLSETTNILGSVYKPPTKIPTLQDMLLGNPLPKSLNPIQVKNGWVFLQIRNTDNVEHVFHLHGHTFYVLGYGKILHSPMDKMATPNSSLSTYPRRDAIQVPLCGGGQGGTGEVGCVPGFVNM
ncbi:UNVERIFIED_CONTAM: laccase [Siphonaria sp. JEL0065]|nr:laccase [Siphonaria sp. JEL0065]